MSGPSSNARRNVYIRYIYVDGLMSEMRQLAKGARLGDYCHSTLIFRDSSTKQVVSFGHNPQGRVEQDDVDFLESLNV